jgi:CheY-like chemotaxis protein
VAAADLPAPPPASLAGLQTQPILVVDGHRVNRRVVEEQLSRWSLTWRSCATAGEAIEAMRQAVLAGQPYGVALIDHRVPDLDESELVRTVRADPALRHAKLVMVTAVAEREEARRLLDDGYAAYLCRPLNFGQLRATLAKLAGDGSPLDQPVTMAVDGTPAGVPVGAPRVMVVEDNRVNQKVVVRQLERLGYEVIVSGDGRQALDALDRQRVDLILTDCQMPEVDGYQLATIVREREEREGGHVPIIAMTAHALPGDRERCLSSGMDDYVSKPVQRRDLEAALQRWCPVGAPSCAGDEAIDKALCAGDGQAAEPERVDVGGM